MHQYCQVSGGHSAGGLDGLKWLIVLICPSITGRYKDPGCRSGWACITRAHSSRSVKKKIVVIDFSTDLFVWERFTLALSTHTLNKLKGSVFRERKAKKQDIGEKPKNYLLKESQPRALDALFAIDCRVDMALLRDSTVSGGSLWLELYGQNWMETIFLKMIHSFWGRFSKILYYECTWASKLMTTDTSAINQKDTLSWTRKRQGHWGNIGFILGVKMEKDCHELGLMPILDFVQKSHQVKRTDFRYMLLQQ